MRFKLLAGNQKLYINILVTMTLSIVLTMLILSTILYVNFENIALEQVYSDSMNSLTQMSRNVSEMTNMSVTLSNQIFSDLNVAKLLYYKNPETYDVRSAMDQLTNYRLTIPFIHSVYVYNGRIDTIYVNAVNDRNTIREGIQNKNNFDDKQAVSLVNDFSKYKQYMPIPRKYVVNPEEGIEKYYYTFLRYDAFTSGNLDGAVIINISEEWINNVISADSTNNESEAFIIDNKGVLVSNRKGCQMMTDISGNGYIRRILDNSAAPGYFIDTVNGEKSLITYTSPNKTGWIYIRIIPWKVLFSRIESMKANTVLIGFGIFLIGMLISVMVSKKLYIPISTMLKKLKSLEEEKKSNIAIIRQGLIKDIVLGRETSNKKLLQEKLSQADVKVDADSLFRMVLLKIDSYDNFCKEYNSEDRNLFKFGIMNIAEEIFSGVYKTETIDIGDGNILALLNIPSEDEVSPDRPFDELLKSIQDIVVKYFNLSLSITVSTDEEAIESLNFVYHQVMEASLHRLFYGHGTIIHASGIIKLKANEYTYPLQKEKLMMEALVAQKIDEVRTLYNEIIYGTSDYPFSAVNLAISRLIFAINDAVNTIRKNNSYFSDFEINLSFSLLNNAETIEEINNQFYLLFDSLNRKLEERKNSKHEEMINKINEVIDSQFHNSGLSIDSIAEALGISPVYMCRLYKQHTLTTILDRIIQVRMESARKLLLETQYSVADIAEKTGFTNSSYFYKSFKKYNGTTPNDFRKNLQ